MRSGENFYFFSKTKSEFKNSLQEGKAKEVLTARENLD
jgi:hypothetical protein